MSRNSAGGEESKRVLLLGRPEPNLADNCVSTSKYTLLTFLPIAIREQFRRNGNVYFLVIGMLMAVGYYTNFFETAISPWTTLGPLAVVVSISLAQEGAADLSRHRSDSRTNNHPCVILRRSDDLDVSGGKRDGRIFNGEDMTVRVKRSGNIGFEEISIAFERVKRMDIRAGNLVLVRNRDMVPADLILLASSGDAGNAYIETSSIDGETNLKLRTSPQIPRSRHDLESLRHMSAAGELPEDRVPLIETLEQATKRITRFSALGNPAGISALLNPANPEDEDEGDGGELSASFINRRKSNLQTVMSFVRRQSLRGSLGGSERGPGSIFVGVLTSEPPNASVNTYSGKLTLPPIEGGMPSMNVPLGAENVLLRGAVLRNTEWAIGVACFTGKDTKLVQNSFQTPSKFSKLDELINRTVLLILTIMVLCVLSLGALSVRAYNLRFDQLWYAGLNNAGEKWPYLDHLDAPLWTTETPNLGQQVFLFITLLNNFVPLSLYVTVEVITMFMMLWLSADLDMYHKDSDTPAQARSTIVTDLGMVKYVFSDKTGTLTQNIMRFKRCSVDGMVFGAPVEKSDPGSLTLDHGANESGTMGEENGEAGVPIQSFHPLRQLLVGAVAVRNGDEDIAKGDGLKGYDGNFETPKDTLTFNAEMFLRVMSICHTVVVEKDFDQNVERGEEDDCMSVGSLSSLQGNLKNLVKKKKKNNNESNATGKGDPSQLETVSEAGGVCTPTPRRAKHSARNYSDKTEMKLPGKSADGAPIGYNYQAESPDEGALVSAASLTYGFQLLGRDSSGVQLTCSSPSLLADKRIVTGLKNGNLTPKALAAETASPIIIAEEAGIEPNNDGSIGGERAVNTAPRLETWSVLAVNKFDSDRKRMSVLVRSPPELGSVPMLLCKGADSSMLDGSVCEAGEHLMSPGEDEIEDVSKGTGIHKAQPQVSMEDTVFLRSVTEEGIEAGIMSNSAISSSYISAKEEGEWEMGAMLGLQAHLGDFASEGLRTLVLGIRILQEEECNRWLDRYRAAATSIKERDKKLTEVALAIEHSLHIVGATAIEDKLQDGVPDTIATLENAGIKLWVLTGDKRETAIEIGYSTKVLTPKMHLAEVADGPADRVRTLMAMEFMRLVKFGKLGQYQHAALNTPAKRSLSLLKCRRTLGGCLRGFSRVFQRSWLRLKVQFAKLKGCLCTRWYNEGAIEAYKETIHRLKEDPVERRRAVRRLADKVIDDYLSSQEGRSERVRRRKAQKDTPVRSKARRGASADSQEKIFRDESPLRTRNNLIQRSDSDAENLSMSSDTLPSVFNRASTARAVLDSQRQAGLLTGSAIRSLSIASETSRTISTRPGAGIVDEDVLSLASFFPDGSADVRGTFDNKKRTVLERLFAVDRHVRHGKLGKHVHKEKMSHLSKLDEAEPAKDKTAEGQDHHSHNEGLMHTPRALVIEGASLVHFLGDPEYEEMLFAVASACDAVIACRVSPKQKALLVRMVRKYVQPTPVTLAVGDGANDVGMIQEAHVGIGISGLEGQQAVNASDFAVAQFRFLRDLLLIHGRWNFIRQCKVVLFSFYKNAVMAGTLIIFSDRCLFSGTPLYDQWVISMFNFVAGFPILFTGLFDRDLEKDYVKRNPVVYASGPNNENITLRITLRWLFLTVIHVYAIYLLSGPALSNGGGMTSAFVGLMDNNDTERPGDGEGGDLKVFGTAIYTCLIFTMGYKVLLETRSLIYGEWPAFTCRKGVGEGWYNRLAYTWIGVFWLSIGFYIWAIYIYSLVGRKGASTFSSFVMVGYHLYNTRAITWIMVILVPTAACVLDVTGKLFANMYFPTQTQIHMEIQAKELSQQRKSNRKEGAGSLPIASIRNMVPV